MLLLYITPLEKQDSILIFLIHPPEGDIGCFLHFLLWKQFLPPTLCESWLPPYRILAANHGILSSSDWIMVAMCHKKNQSELSLTRDRNCEEKFSNPLRVGKHGDHANLLEWHNK